MAEAVASFVGRTKLKLAIDSACSTQDDPIPSELTDHLTPCLLSLQACGPAGPSGQAATGVGMPGPCRCAAHRRLSAAASHRRHRCRPSSDAQSMCWTIWCSRWRQVTRGRAWMRWWRASPTALPS